MDGWGSTGESGAQSLQLAGASSSLPEVARRRLANREGGGRCLLGLNGPGQMQAGPQPSTFSD
jgi:hypothetical protein